MKCVRKEGIYHVRCNNGKGNQHLNSILRGVLFYANYSKKDSEEMSHGQSSSTSGFVGCTLCEGGVVQLGTILM